MPSRDEPQRVEALVEPGAGSVAERVAVEPEPEPEPEPEKEKEPEPEPEKEPEEDQQPEEVALESEVDVEADLEPELEAASIETCSQCGADLLPADIFCGECGFVRQAVARGRDTAVLDPFPWGLPRSLETTPAVVFDDDVDETRIIDRNGGGERFVLQFSTGESVSVTGTGLLGRNPLAEPGEYFDTLVTITDPGKSVSKTHLEFGQDAGSFWVSDRFSGNGTIVREPEGQPRRCDPGKRYRIARGTRVDIGEQFFIVS